MPSAHGSKAMLTMFGPHLTSEIVVPSDKFRPDHATVTFTLDAPDVRLKFSLPKWNTHALHAPAGGYDIGTLGDFNIKGSYLYWAFVRNDTVDKLKLTFTVRMNRMLPTFCLQPSPGHSCCVQSAWLDRSILYGAQGQLLRVVYPLLDPRRVP